MAKVLGGIGQQLSGSVEGLVFVRGEWGSHMRSMPRERKADEWSDKQRQARNGFGAVIHHAGLHKLTVIDPIWNKAAKGSVMSGYNLFVKANRAAFDSHGNLGDAGLLHFSAGSLALPYRFTAVADAQNPGAIAVSWTDQLAGSVHGDDCLMAVIYKEGANEIVNTGFTRKQGMATIVNPRLGAGEVFLFLFFWNKTLDVYSSDQVFAIK